MPPAVDVVRLEQAADCEGCGLVIPAGSTAYHTAAGVHCSATEAVLSMEGV